MKIVISLADDRFERPLNEGLRVKIENEGVKDENLAILDEPSYENFYRYVIDYADGVVVTSEKADPQLVEYARSKGKHMLEYQSVEDAELFDNYNRFYDEL